MSEILLKNGRINWPFILVLGGAASFLHLVMHVTLLHMFPEHPSSNLVYALTAPFLELMIWSFIVLKLPSENQTLKIVVPATSVAVVAITMSYFLNLNYSPSENFSTKVFQLLWLVLAFFCIVAFCEVFYKKIRNKVLLYALSLIILSPLHVLYQIATDQPYFLQGTLLVYVSVKMITAFLAMFLLKMLNIPYILPVSHKENLISDIRKKIHDGLLNHEKRFSIYERLKGDHPEVSAEFLSSVFVQTADVYEKKKFKVVNWVLWILIVTSILFHIVSFFKLIAEGLRFYSWADVINSVILMLLPLMICFKLVFAGDLIQWRSYVYRIISIMSLIAILFYLLLLVSGKAMALVGFAGYILSYIFATRISRNLFPNYRLIRSKGNPHRQFEV